MRPTFCGFRHRPRPSEKQPPISNCGLGESVRRFLRPRSFWAAVKNKPRQFSGAENQEVQVYKGPTLEDLITSSPGFNGGEIAAHKQSSRRIHPSFDGGVKPEVLAKSGGGKMAVCRTKSGKEKKKVSFRSPEVAEVFVVEYPPEIRVIDKNEVSFDE